MNLSFSWIDFQLIYFYTYIPHTYKYIIIISTFSLLLYLLVYYYYYINTNIYIYTVNKYRVYVCTLLELVVVEEYHLRITLYSN